MNMLLITCMCVHNLKAISVIHTMIINIVCVIATLISIHKQEFMIYNISGVMQSAESVPFPYRSELGG